MVLTDLYMRFHDEIFNNLVKGQVKKIKNAPSKIILPQIVFSKNYDLIKSPPTVTNWVIVSTARAGLCEKIIKMFKQKKKKCSIANIVDFSLVSSYIILNTMRIVNNISEQRMSRTAVVETIGLLNSIYYLTFKSCFRNLIYV